MKRKLGEIWKVKEGSKTIWKVQFPKGIMNFTTKKEAEKWSKTFCKREMKSIKLNDEELKILINLVSHEIEWANNDNFYREYKKQLENIKSQLESEVK